MTDLQQRIERNAFATGLSVGIVIGAFLMAIAALIGGEGA